MKFYFDWFYFDCHGLYNAILYFKFSCFNREIARPVSNIMQFSTLRLFIIRLTDGSNNDDLCVLHAVNRRQCVMWRHQILMVKQISRSDR